MVSKGIVYAGAAGVGVAGGFLVANAVSDATDATPRQRTAWASLTTIVAVGLGVTAAFIITEESRARSGGS